jgi:ribosomal protein S2
MLLGFGSQFGTLSFKEWNSDSSGYIYSRVHSRFLINLSLTSMLLSRALKFVNFCSSRRLRLLYFMDEEFTAQLYEFNGSRRFWGTNFFLINRWIPGTLTNYKSIRGKLMKFRDCTNFLSYANVVVFLGNIHFSNIISSESRGARLPSIGLVDMDGGYSPFSYSIPSNNKVFTIHFAYYRLFFQSTRSGWFLANSILGKKFRNYTRKFIKKFSAFFRFVVPRSQYLNNIWRKALNPNLNTFKRGIHASRKWRYSRNRRFRTSFNKRIKIFKTSTLHFDLIFHPKVLRRKNFGVYNYKKKSNFLKKNKNFGKKSYVDKKFERFKR